MKRTTKVEFLYLVALNQNNSWNFVIRKLPRNLRNFPLLVGKLGVNFDYGYSLMVLDGGNFQGSIYEARILQQKLVLFVSFKVRLKSLFFRYFLFLKYSSVKTCSLFTILWWDIITGPTVGVFFIFPKREISDFSQKKRRVVKMKHCSKKGLSLCWLHFIYFISNTVSLLLHFAIH